MAKNEFLKKCYSLSAAAEVKAFYDEHAETYDKTLLQDIGYIAPRVSAEVFKEFSTDWDAPVIDLGCGTGLVGEALAGLGFSTIDGADYATGMLRQAQDKHCYRELFTLDLNEKFAIDDNSYAAAISVGAFSEAHIKKTALVEVLRIVRPGGLIGIMLNERALHAHGFYDEFQHLEDAGKAELLYLQEHDYHLNEGIKGWFSLLRVI